MMFPFPDDLPERPIVEARIAAKNKHPQWTKSYAALAQAEAMERIAAALERMAPSGGFITPRGGRTDGKRPSGGSSSDAGASMVETMRPVVEAAQAWAEAQVGDRETVNALVEAVLEYKAARRGA